MKIEIKLGDPKNCMGCPMLEFDHRTGWFECHLFAQEVSGFVGAEGELRKTITKEDIVRPQECIDKHGE